MSLLLFQFQGINMSKIENSVCEKIQLRAEFGVNKYGTTLERKDLTPLDWLVHAQEEVMDLAGYLEVLIQQELKMNMLEQHKKVLKEQADKILGVEPKFKIGDNVVKVGGDYTFEGIVRAAFPKGSGVIRYVVEDDRGILHVYSDKVLKLKAPI